MFACSLFPILSQCLCEYSRFRTKNDEVKGRDGGEYLKGTKTYKNQQTFILTTFTLACFEFSTYIITTILVYIVIGSSNFYIALN